MRGVNTGVRLSASSAHIKPCPRRTPKVSVVCEHQSVAPRQRNGRDKASLHAKQPARRTKRDEDHAKGLRQQQQQPASGQQPSDEIPVVRQSHAGSSTFFSSAKFSEIGASDEIVQALAALGITRPSHIQAAAFRALGQAGARSLVLADHAGSGKTLAYLLPVLQMLKQEEQLLGHAATQPRCPRAVVVVPTAELCAQVLRVCRALSRAGLRFRSAAATGGRPMRTQKDTLASGVDVLIGTPGRLSELLKGGAFELGYCRAVVCDEVDVLLGQDFSFADQVAPLKAAAAEATRFIFATATLPEQVYIDLEEAFPGLAAALGPGLHRTAPGVTEQLVDCSGGNEVSEESGFRRKAAALYAVLQEQRAQRTIVFCNKIETCRKVENFLNRTLSQQDLVQVLPHHAAVSEDKREANLNRFLAAPTSTHQQRHGRSAGGSSLDRLVLVCTDRASRGMDSAFVEHVVLFDMPRDPSEYLRRVGRTVRGAGSSGVVSVLTLGRQVKLAREIIDRNQNGLVLHRVPAALPAAAGPSGAERVKNALDMATGTAGQREDSIAF